jgi:hypothetical protein
MALLPGCISPKVCNKPLNKPHGKDFEFLSKSLKQTELGKSFRYVQCQTKYGK